MARIELEGNLQLELGDARVEISAAGARVRAEIGDLEPRPRSLRQAASYVTFARRLSRLLDLRGLTLAITKNGAPFAELGAGVRGGPLERLFGLPRVRAARRSRKT